MSINLEDKLEKKQIKVHQTSCRVSSPIQILNGKSKNFVAKTAILMAIGVLNWNNTKV